MHQRRVGGPLEQLYYKWGLAAIRNLPINIFELKAVFLALKHSQGQLRQKIVLVSSDNSTVVSYINKEGGTHSFEMCALMWRILAWSNDPYQSQTYSRESQCNRFPVQEGQGHSDRVVFASSGLSRNLPSLAQANGGSVCHQLECQTSNLRVSPVPDDKAWQIDALNISWEALDAYAFCPVAILPQLVQKVIAYRCRVIVIAPGWPGMSWFWGLVEWSAKIPLRLPQVYNLLKQPFSLRFHKNLEYLNLHAWYLDSYRKVKEDSLLRWQIELRHLRGNPQDECMIQGGPFFRSGPRRIRWMSQNQLFLK